MLDHIVAFGAHRLDLGQRLLTRFGQPVSVGRRGMDILCVLARAGGQPVGKDVLLDVVWNGRFIGENNLHVHISALRKALGADSGAMLTTVPGVGYQLAIRPADPPPSPGRVVVIADTFRALTTDARHANFAAGLREDLLIELSGVPWLVLMDEREPIISGPCYRLGGGLRWFGARVHATARLTDKRNEIVGARRYDFPARDTIKAQTALANDIAVTIKGILADRHDLTLSAADERRRLWYALRRLSRNTPPTDDSLPAPIDWSDPSAVFY